MILTRVIGQAPRVAIVGGGPAAFYTAHFLLKGNPDVCVDMFEERPVPFGLVRYGVAPDHQDVKNVTAQFETVGANPRVRFTGNVALGRQFTLADLRHRYPAVVLAYGAAADRPLNIPGEDAAGVISAREFVGWYNGAPEHAHVAPPLNTARNVVIVGNGNVALDLARLLAAPYATLASSDMPPAAVTALSSSSVTTVTVLGRRGPLDVAFTTKEFRALTHLPNCHVNVDPAAMTLTDAETAHVATSRPLRRLVDLLERTANAPPPSPPAFPPPLSPLRQIVFKFCAAPVEVVADSSGHVAAVTVAHTKLEGPPGNRRVVGTVGEPITIPCDLLLRSIGYQGLAADPTLPFNDRTGTISHAGGRVDGLPGVFCSGWIKTGPVGVIATTMSDASATVDAVLHDLAALQRLLPPSNSDFVNDLRAKIFTTDFADWLQIDKLERTAGAALGKVRLKMLCTNDEILQSRIAASEYSQ